MRNSSSVDCWCSVRFSHHSTDRFTMGISTAPPRPTIAARRARACGAAGTERSARYPAYARNSTRAVTWRTSPHSHQVPHTGRPQIIPVRSVIAHSTTPISAQAWARRSHQALRRHRYTALAIAQVPSAT